MAKQEDKVKLQQLKAEVVRRKLIERVSQKRVNIMAKVEDKIPNTFTGEPQKQKMRWL